MTKLSRKTFFANGIRDLCVLGGTAVLGAGLVKLAFGAESANDVLVVLFLRGACDALNLLPPLDGPDRALYEAARPNLKVPNTGEKAALNLNDRLGFHPAARPLNELFKAGRLAIVQGAGLTSDTRSHFDAQAYMELGTPDRKDTTSGWITRHLLGRGRRSQAPSFLTAVSLGSLTPNSLLAYPAVAVINALDNVNIAGPKATQYIQREALRRLYAGQSWLDRYGRETLDAIDAFESVSPAAYRPAGRDYPKGDIGNRLRMLAQMIKMNLGLSIATVDMGGWDTHKYQGEGAEGTFANLVGQLSSSLAAFHEDLDAGGGPRVTVVVMSEFGRRVKENASRGTDHGHGTMMMVLGKQIAGGKIYGLWPGLETDRLYERADLAVTTDYRKVLGELVMRRLGNPALGSVFPGYADTTPLGIVSSS